MMPLRTRTKQDLIKVLGSREIHFIEELEIVSDSDIRALSERLKSLLRSQKRIHVSIVERAAL